MINHVNFSINKIYLEVSQFIRCMRKHYRGRMTKIVIDRHLDKVRASYGVQLTDKVPASDGVEVTHEVASAQGVEVPLD